MWKIVLVGLCLAPSVSGIHTVTELDVNKYLGRWYQMYASESVMLTFEFGAVCVTADYGLNSNGTVSILNSNLIKHEDGELKVIRGYAQPTNVTGQLNVHLQGVHFVAPYWVFKLGPATYGSQGLYQYSLITDDRDATLFVLARNVTTFRSDYQQEVLDYLKQEGFTKLYNMPVETTHNDKCKYGPPPQ